MRLLILSSKTISYLIWTTLTRSSWWFEICLWLSMMNRISIVSPKSSTWKSKTSLSLMSRVNRDNKKLPPPTCNYQMLLNPTSLKPAGKKVRINSCHKRCLYGSINVIKLRLRIRLSLIILVKVLPLWRRSWVVFCKVQLNQSRSISRYRLGRSTRICRFLRQSCRTKVIQNCFSTELLRNHIQISARSVPRNWPVKHCL
jgi:hypothetical protein